MMHHDYGDRVRNMATVSQVYPVLMFEHLVLS